MTAAPSAALVRLRRPVSVLVDLPATENFPSQIISGDLVAAMMVDGAIHHFRVQDADAITWYVWPSWIMGDAPVVHLATMAEAVA